MIHEVQIQMKCILLNKRPHDISLARLRDQICRVYQSVSLLLLQFQRRKFQNHDYKIDQSIEFSQTTTYWASELDNNELHCCLVDINPYTWPFKIR